MLNLFGRHPLQFLARRTDHRRPEEQQFVDACFSHLVSCFLLPFRRDIQTVQVFAHQNFVIRHERSDSMQKSTRRGGSCGQTLSERISYHDHRRHNQGQRGSIHEVGRTNAARSVDTECD